MSTLTHSVEPIADFYVLNWYDTEVAKVQKTEYGFWAQMVTGEEAELSTMKAIKEWALPICEKLQGVIDRATKRPFYITVDDCRSTYGISHSRLREYLKLIRKVYPWLRKEQLGAAIAKMALEEKIHWPHNHYDYDRKIYEEIKGSLPHLPEVDWDEYNKTGRVVYLTPPYKG